jgi:hypothetical protein
MNTRHELSRQTSLERARASIEKRLKRVCADMPAEEFQQLVTRMANIQVKYTTRRGEDLFPSRNDPDSV